MTSSVTASRRSSLSEACGLNALQPPATKHWLKLETVAAGMRHGAPDRGNTNGTGACGLANKHQLHLGGLSFNAHSLPSDPLSPDMDVHKAIPVIFAQSPDLHGRGTGASALAWLQMAAANRSPIVQFVHPRTLRDGSYSGELSLIELLQRQDPEAQLYSISEVSQLTETDPVKEPQRSRRFMIGVAQQPFGNDIQPAELQIDVTLYASKLDNHIMPETDIRSAGDAINRLFAGSQKVALAGAPLLMSYGGFGRSSCVGLYLSITQLLRENPNMTYMQYLKCLDDLIIRGKSLRGAQFVPSFAQYQELRAAVEKRWIAHVQERHGFFLQPSAFDGSIAMPGVTPPGTIQHKYPLRPVISTLEPRKDSATLPHPSVAQSVNLGAAAALKECVSQLMMTQVNGVDNYGSRKVKNLGPYMPVNPKGVEELKTLFELPALTAERAAKYRRDIIAGGFYGDALGSDLESMVPGKKISLLAGTGAPSGTLVTHLRNNLRRTHYRHGHHATDDTQQGVLAALATRNWLDSLPRLHLTDLPGAADDLAERISDSFKRPHFPARSDSVHSLEPFAIRGGADTLRMIQDRGRAAEVAWQDRCITKFRTTGTGVQTIRAGGAGNGGIMRIAYDLIPHLGRQEGVDGESLIHHVLLSNQVTHPSSLSAVASAGHVLALINCIKHRDQGTKPSPESLFFLNTYATVANALQYQPQNKSIPVTSDGSSPAPELSTFALQNFERDPSVWAQLEADRMLMGRLDGENRTISDAASSILHKKRLPSEILTGETTGNLIDCGSVKFALQAFKQSKQGQEILHRVRTQTLTKHDLEHLNCIMGRWGSNAYLGATLPSIVFLLELLGYSDPVQAIEVAAILTKDNDTCAAIIGQLMGALHGTEWFEMTSGSKRLPPSLRVNGEALTHFSPYLAGNPENGFFSIDEAIRLLGA